MTTWSKSQIDKLGDRLRGTHAPSSEDLEGYQEMCVRYEQPLATVVEAVETVGYQLTTRYPKTAGTLIEKLKRDRTRLSTVQDIAGVRVVVQGNRVDQDNATDRIVKSLERQGAVVEIRDRREEPSAGYRAVHVIASVDGIPVEIQIRTHLQDGWANLMEKFADIFGRQVRYGDSPDNPDDPVLGSTPSELMERILNLSDFVDQVERLTVDTLSLKYHPSEADEIRELWELEDVDDSQLEQTVRQILESDLSSYERTLTENFAILQNLLGGD